MLQSDMYTCFMMGPWERSWLEERWGSELIRREGELAITCTYLYIRINVSKMMSICNY